MLNNDLSDAMKKQVEKIIEKIGDESIVANITMKLSSPKFPEYKMSLCKEIQSMTLHQDFATNITDKLTAELLLDKETYVSLVYMRKNLYCQLEITYVDPEEVVDEVQYERKPDYSKKFKVFLVNWEDLFKKFSSEQLFPKQRPENAGDIKLFNLSIELLAEDVFKARKEACYITGRDVKMEDMIRYCVNYFGYKKAHISTVHNVKKYSNFVIPPAYGVEEIMSYLQTAPSLGIFKDGLISYIMNGCWYIYPRDGEPLGKCPIHVYCLGGARFEGMGRNDWEEGCSSGGCGKKCKTKNTASTAAENAASSSTSSSSTQSSENKDDKGETAETVTGKFPLHILSPFELEEINWAHKSENEYTSLVAQMSDLLVDSSRELVNDQKTNLVRCVHYPTVVPYDIMDYETYIRVKHVKSRGNLFTICSDARAMQGRTLTFKWEHARPWVFQPATVVYVHYDSHKQMQDATGICERADFVFKRYPESRTMPMWTCMGTISVYCSVRGEKMEQSRE